MRIRTEPLLKPNKYISIALSLFLSSVFLYLSGRDIKVLLNSQLEHAPMEYVLAVMWGVATVILVMRALKALRTE